MERLECNKLQCPLRTWQHIFPTSWTHACSFLYILEQLWTILQAQICFQDKPYPMQMLTLVLTVKNEASSTQSLPDFEGLAHAASWWLLQ